MVILPVWILLVPMVYGMFHELSMEYFNSSLPKDSLFGYSIAYLPSRKSILVGAPNANYIGNVFNINVISKKIEEIPIDIESETFPNLAHGVWLGATVKAAKDTFVSCAPRRLWHKGYCTGECIISKDDIYTPGIKSSKIKFLNSFGSSLEVVSGKKGIEILVGDPSFSSNWLSRYTHPFVEPQLIELEKFRPDLQKIYNFGYNVATGNFFSNHDYVISTTYGTVGLGMVFIFNSNLINVETIEDNAVGSMFGASLCRVHLDDGRASLLVGAPTFSETHSFDVGAVYLYKVNTNTGSKMTLVRKITGTTNGGYFGYAITNLGDIDGDKLDDIAIGAPYEGDGRGSVYIYTGAGLVNHKGPRQVIKAKDIWNLGFSFTTIKDDDASGCNGISNSCSVVRSCCTCAS